MLKREVNFHLDAVSQLFENLNRLDQLRYAVNKGNIFPRLITTLEPVSMDNLEVFKSLLGLCIALCHVLLKEVNCREVFLHPRKEVKDDLLCLLALKQGCEKGAP